MKKLSLKDYYIEKELSEKHSLECRIYNARSQLNYHESINNILNCQTIVNSLCKFSQFNILLFFY